MNENKIKLEELLKDKWDSGGVLSNNQIILAKCGERIVYNIDKEEIVVRYSTEIER